MDLAKVAETMICELYERVRYQNSDDKLAISVNEKQYVRLSWTTFLGGNPTQAGLDMFYRMFENHPETKQSFKFVSEGAEGKMQDSSRLVLHITMVSRMIGNVIDNLDNLENIVPTLLSVGGRHGTDGYNIDESFFPFLGEATCQLIKEKMGDAFTDKHLTAWNKLFDFINGKMVEGQRKYN